MFRLADQDLYTLLVAASTGSNPGLLVLTRTPVVKPDGASFSYRALPSLGLYKLPAIQIREAAEFREVKLKGKNHILKTGHYRLKNELKSDHKKVEQLQEQVC